MNCPACASENLQLVRSDKNSGDSWMEHTTCLDCGRSMIPTKPYVPAPVFPDPPRLEDTDPELAEFLRQVANKEHPIACGVKLESTMVAIHHKATTQRESRWVGYVIPVTAPVTPGRNDPCHCGSGRKFKRCHG